jgi:APA family basic amino acid/polyamine antiporter
MVALFRLRRTRADLPRPVKAFGYPIVPGLYMVALVGVMITQLWAKPLTAGAGLAIVAIGIPVYLWWSRRATA